MSGVDLSLEPLSGVLEQADHARCAPASHPVSRVWPTGFDLLDQTLGRRPPLRRAGAARRPAGPGQDDLGAPGRPQHRPVGPLGAGVLLRARPADAAGPAGRPRGRPARRPRRARREPDPAASFEAIDGRHRVARRAARATPRAASRRSTRPGVRRPAGAAPLDRHEHRPGRRSPPRSTRSARRTGESPLVVVDYLQKVHVPDADRRGRADHRGHRGPQGPRPRPRRPDPRRGRLRQGGPRAAGQRMRVSNMRGSSALAYEADTVLLLNNKYDVVARHHLVYSMGNVEKFRDWAVLTVEKNRNGRAGRRAGVPQALRPVPLRHRPAGRRRAAGRRARLRRVSTRRLPARDAAGSRWLPGPSTARGEAVRPRRSRRRCGCGWGRPGRRGPWSWRR